jgi:uncharacterized protein (DUF2384 family)
MIEALRERLPDVRAIGTERVDAAAAKALPRIFNAWGLDNEEAAELLRVGSRTYQRMKAQSWVGSLDEDQRVRASAIVGIYKALHVYFSDDLADHWIQLPNKGSPFNERTPLFFMREGGIPALLFVRQFLDALRGGA